MKFLIPAILVLLIACLPGCAEDPESQKVESQEIVISVEPDGCSDGCLGLSQWRNLVSDNFLLDALALAYTYNQQWRRFAQIAARKSTKIIWANLDRRTLGQYLRDQNTVLVSRSLQNEPLPLVASILSHELVHVSQEYKQDSYACFRDELQAFEWEALTWSMLRQYSRTTKLTIAEDALVNRWRRGTLQRWVQEDHVYWGQCEPW
jgi:hypothetical protein